MTTQISATGGPAKEPAKDSLAAKRLIARIAVSHSYIMFALTTLLIVYAILKLNVYLILVLLSMVILQKLFLKRNMTIINWLRKTFHPELYFNKFQKIYEGEVPETGVLFSHHPHAVWSLALILSLNQGNDPYSKIVQLGSRFILNTPYIGGFIRLWGIQSVHAANMNRLMSKGINIGLVPGGYEEATITSEEKFRIYIKKRKGFIKMALKTGYKICPVLVMNQHKMYKTTDFGLKYRLLLNKLKIPGALFWGRYGIFPDPNLDIYTIIGKPIEMPKIEKPTAQQIKKWHKHYIDVVTALYEKYKHLNGNSPLEIY